jgi:hypothetical protein
MNKLIGDEMDYETNNLLNELVQGRYSRFEDTTHFIDDEWLDSFCEEYICSTPDWA